MDEFSKEQASDQSLREQLAACERLARKLLGMSFYDGSKWYRTHVGSRFIWADRLRGESDYVNSQAELSKLMFLFKHLTELQQHHKNAFRRVRKAIRRATTEALYFGARMEALIAASFVRARVPFTSQEAPDFTLGGDYFGCGVECGSGNLVNANQHYANKIGMVVNRKNLKGYATRQVALFVDITNPIFHSINQVNIHEPDIAPLPADRIVRQRVSDVIADRGFGCVNLFSYVLRNAGREIRSAYVRVDAPDIDSRLLRFMDTHYPTGRVRIPDGLYPNQG